MKNREININPEINGLPHELFEEQKEKLREFCQEYDIGFPEGV